MTRERMYLICAIIFKLFFSRAFCFFVRLDLANLLILERNNLIPIKQIEKRKGEERKKSREAAAAVV